MNRLTDEPYRLLFPLAALLGTVGVGHWLLYTLGILEGYSGQGHALVQIQAFLMAFACGFLFTMIPRRTQTTSPTYIEILLVSFLFTLVTASSLLGRWTVAETSFLAVLAVLVRFLASRIRRSEAQKLPLDAFLLVPIGLMSGCAGALLVLLADVSLLGVWAIPVGRGLIQEGMFLCLVLGIGHILLPSLMGYAGLPDAECLPSEGRRWIYVAVGLLLVGSFPCEYALTEELGIPVGRRIGYGVRFALVTATMIAGLRAYRWPIVPGLNLRLVWIAVWLLPLGLGLTVAFPAYKVAMLHVMFVGGLNLLVFSISSHVIAVHGGRTYLTVQKPWQVWSFGGLFLLAMLTRVTADLFLESYWAHIGGAAGVWILALVFWMSFLFPNLSPERSEQIDC